MPFRWQTMCNAGWCQRRCCAETQECHETSTTAARSSSFLMYEVPLRIFYVQLLFFGTKIPMLSAPFIDGSPYLFYAKNICHLYSLLAPIRTIVNSILQGWTTRMTMFFVIAVAEIRLTNALSSQKMTLYPVSFHRASIPTETNLPHDLKKDYILMAT